MTANAMAGDREKAVAAGMNDHIAKPIDVKEMFAVLGQWIEVAERRRNSQTPPPKLRDDAPTVQIPDLAEIDMVAGLKHMGGSASLYLEILDKFRESQADAIERIQAGDAQTAQREAHTLKGLAGNIGAHDLQNAAARVEAALKNSEGKLDELLPELKTRLNTILTELKRLAEMNLPIEESAQDSSKGKPIPTEKLLTELYALVEDDDTEAVNLLDRLLARFTGTEQEQIMKNIAKLIHDYEFDEALEALDSFQSDMQKMKHNQA